MPVGLGPLVADMSETDRSVLLVYSRLFGLAELRDLRQNLVDMRKNPVAAEFDSLPPDADEASRQTLAEHYAAQFRALISRYPWISERYAVGHSQNEPSARPWTTSTILPSSTSTPGSAGYCRRTVPRERSSDAATALDCA